jgi:hypothetical protein
LKFFFEKLIKLKKKIIEKQNREKTPIKPVKNLKNRPVRFRFYKLKTKKTKPKPKKIEKKPEPNSKNQVKTESNRFLS